MVGTERNRIDESQIEALLGLDASKIGFYADVKQKIQELEAANVDLLEKKNELQAVFNSIADGVAIFDRSGTVVFQNHLCPGLLGEKKVVGLHCSQIFHPGRRRAPSGCPVEGALAGKRRRVEFTVTPGNEVRYLEATATPIARSLGRPARALVFLRDVTEKRLQELQLVQAEKMSSIGLLAAGVAHEINNPVASIAFYAEALIRRLDEGAEITAVQEVFRDYLGVVVREAHRCKSIVDGLLSFSRRSDGSRGHVWLNSLVSEVLDLVRPLARMDEIEVRDELHPELPPVSGDAAGLRQVVLNLTLNALQSIGHRGRVTLSTRTETGRVVFQVADTGCGIPPEHLDQIWTPFFTTKPVGKGLGLGLFVTYNIVQKHAGEILVETQPGCGSTFVVRLPASAEFFP